MLKQITAKPPWKIGIIGGGQLGKMMAVAAKQMGLAIVILDPKQDCPAASLADQQIVAEYTDRAAVASLAASCQVITYEFEHIDSQVLIDLARAGHQVHPAPEVLQLIQNKLTQKIALAKAGIPVPAFAEVKNSADLAAAGEKYGYPLLVKTCAGGYDGKGNFLLKSPDQIGEALAVLGCGQLMVEEFIPFELEVSVMVARDRWGEIVIYPLSENHHQDNILKKNIVPARVDGVVTAKALQVAKQVMEIFKGTGIFCVEMFVTGKGMVLVNEVAPRPHNSGHYTIEACVTSQFEQHIRAIVGLPLGSARLKEPSVSVNLLGAEGHIGPAVLLGCDQALGYPGVHLHFYGKTMTQPQRKMGHVTITAPNMEEALIIADKVTASLEVVALVEGAEGGKIHE